MKTSNNGSCAISTACRRKRRQISATGGSVIQRPCIAPCPAARRHKAGIWKRRVTRHDPRFHSPLGRNTASFVSRDNDSCAKASPSDTCPTHLHKWRQIQLPAALTSLLCRNYLATDPRPCEVPQSKGASWTRRPHSRG